MSKGNMLLGQARGKVGDVVFYVRNGVQQVRPRNRQPANPQTINQMNQRVKMAAPVGFYKRNSPFFKMAFRKSERESYYNAFIRLNINIGPYLTREMVVDGYKAPAPYIVADGTMPSIAVTSTAGSSATTLKLTTSIPTTLTTWGDFRRHYNLVYGDMLTIVTFDSQSFRESLVTRAIVQHVFDVASDNLPIGYDMSGTYWAMGGANAIVEVSSEFFGQPEWHDTGSAFILSRNSGSVNCSFAQLKLNESAQEIYDELRTDAARQIAVASYAEINNAVLDPINADDNEAEFLQLYKDADCTIPLNNATQPLGDSVDAYFKTSELPAFSSGTVTKLAGVSNVERLSLVQGNHIYIEVSNSIVGTGTYRLAIKSSETAMPRYSVVTVTTTASE